MLSACVCMAAVLPSSGQYWCNMELCPLMSMRVDGIMYLPYHGSQHGSNSVKSTNNGLVLTHLLNMANTAQEIFSFGDFSNLSPEEQDTVQNILHGDNAETSRRKVEFPWDKDGVGVNQFDSFIDYDDTYKNPPPAPPSVVPVATLYPGSGPVPHLPHGAAIFSSPIVPLVFSPPVNLPPAPINRTSTVGPPPGLIPIGLTVVNEITMSRPTELHPEVMNISPNIPVPPCPQIIPVCNNIDVPAVAPSVDVNSENMKSFSNSRETISNTEDENQLRADEDEEGSKSAKIIADLKNRERRNKKVRPKDYYKKFEGTELSTNEASDVETTQCANQNKDFDNVPSGKIENDFNPDYFSDTISFFDTEVSAENGILCDSPSLELLMDKHKQDPVKIFDQKDNSNCGQVDAKIDTADLCEVEALVIIDGKCQPSNKPNEKFLFKESNNCDINSVDQQNKGNCKQDKNATTVPEPVDGGCSQEQFESSVDDETKVDAGIVSSTEKVKAEASNQSNVPTTTITITTTTTTSTATVTTKEAPADLAQPKPKMSWAGLFKNTLSTSRSIVVYSESPQSNEVSSAMLVSSTALASGTSGTVQSATTSSQKTSPDHQFVKENSPQPQAPVSPANDSLAQVLGVSLRKISLTYKPVSLQPRGLINKGNWCYINATLQALVACPPFYHLIKQLPLKTPDLRGPSSTPVVDAMFRFVNEFHVMSHFPVNTKKRPQSYELTAGSSFEPSYVYKMLHMIESTMSFKFGKQEDAEEFLSFVLNRLHEEMLGVINITGNNSKQDPDTKQHPANGFLLDENCNSEEDLNADEWEQVGPKNKSVFTRRASFSRTLVADIFAGQIRSAVYQTASRESATLEPFFTLQLDIQSPNVSTVKDALEGLVSREAVHGFTCSKTNSEVEITKRLTLEELPPVLILHLKCFIYDKNGGIQKVLKKIDYPIDLDINKDLLSPIRSRMPINQRNYTLFAVLFHHGKAASGGHYTTDAYHSGLNGWVRYDDSIVRQVPVSHVLKFVPNRIPYLLFYRRCDLS